MNPTCLSLICRSGSSLGLDSLSRGLVTRLKDDERDAAQYLRLSFSPRAFSFSASRIAW